jgi:uncharacterized protein (TIGR00251 family)
MFITVDVKPGQREKKIHVINEKHIILYVKAQAIKGKANREAIKILRNYYGKHVILISGHTSSRKIFEV